MIRDAEHLFMCLVGLPYVFLGEVSIQVFFPFFNQIVCLLDFAVKLYEFFIDFL